MGSVVGVRRSKSNGKDADVVEVRGYSILKLFGKTLLFLCRSLVAQNHDMPAVETAA